MPHIGCQSVFTDEDEQMLEEAAERVGEIDPEILKWYWESGAYARAEAEASARANELIKERVEERLRTGPEAREPKEERPPTPEEAQKCLRDTYKAAPNRIQEKIWRYEYQDRKVLNEHGQEVTGRSYALRSYKGPLLKYLTAEERQTLQRSNKWIVEVYTASSIEDVWSTALHEIHGEVAWEDLPEETQATWEQTYERVKGEGALELVEKVQGGIYLKDAQDLYSEMMAMVEVWPDELRLIDAQLFELTKQEVIANETERIREDLDKAGVVPYTPRKVR